MDALLKALGSVIESQAVANALNAFSMAAILSSFIGVGLGVFDYLADLFKFDNSRAGRAKSWGVTFLPPLVLSLLFPFGFLMAIGYAGAVATPAPASYRPCWPGRCARRRVMATRARASVRPAVS